MDEAKYHSFLFWDFIDHKLLWSVKNVSPSKQLPLIGYQYCFQVQLNKKCDDNGKISSRFRKRVEIISYIQRTTIFLDIISLLETMLNWKTTRSNPFSFTARKCNINNIMFRNVCKTNNVCIQKWNANIINSEQSRLMLHCISIM
jgi:hypothetical protein